MLPTGATRNWVEYCSLSERRRDWVECSLLKRRELDCVLPVEATRRIDLIFNAWKRRGYVSVFRNVRELGLVLLMSYD